MDIPTFAEKYRCAARRQDGEQVIPGKLGHVYEHGSATFGLMFMPDKARLWKYARRRLEAADFTIWQDGDEEGSALFDPTSPAQARLALKVVGARRNRRASPAQLANLRKTLDTRPCSRVESPIPA